jgi:hypothetical protein
MNREDPYRDQAERLRQKIERVPFENDGHPGKLPPRSEIHRNKKKKHKWKLKYPVIRLLALFFILLPITIYSAYTYLDNKESIGKKEVVITDSEGYEPIELETRNDPIDSGDEEDSETSALFDEDLDEEANTSEIEPVTDNEASIPSPADKATTEPFGNKDSEPETSNQEQGIVYHTVQPNETLFRIAIKYYHSKEGIEIIRNANGIQGNEIQTGQVLKIPLQK